MKSDTSFCSSGESGMSRPFFGLRFLLGLWRDPRVSLLASSQTLSLRTLLGTDGMSWVLDLLVLGRS
jgi:hypothetical protein